MERLCGLVEPGSPVCIKLSSEGGGVSSDRLFCELVQDARFGRSFRISGQACRVGRYVLSGGESPASYYVEKGRYQTPDAARHAASSLPRLNRDYTSLELKPLNCGDARSASTSTFDALILFLLPAAAMRLVQALSYYQGDRVKMEIGGAASVCGETAAQALNGSLGVSVGCKGSRKHSRYPDEEMVVGIPRGLATKIEAALAKMPGTRIG